VPTPAERHLTLIDTDADLEAALTAAERASTGATTVSPGEEPERSDADDTEPDDTEPDDTEPDDAEAGPVSTTGVGSALPRPRARQTIRPPASVSPPPLAVGRPVLVDALKERLPGRQLAWITWSALAGATAAATGLAASQPLLTLAATLGVGAWAAFPRRIGRGPLLVAATVTTALLVGLALAHDPTVIVAGPELMAAGAVAGLGLSFLDGQPADRWRRGHAALGGAAATGLGLWVATAFVGSPATGSAAWGAVYGGIFGLVASQSLVAAALAWVETDRIPSLTRIRTTLSPPYREPCEQAWRLDRALQQQAPDRDSREGLGEVAAWVYRLQWSLQALDRELDAIDAGGLAERRVDLLDRAAAADDDFTRQRLLATAEHLAAMRDHHAALQRERDRSEAMREYASAFLEEARAGLALARVQPGEQVPARLHQVLDRLRTHAAERDAHRRTVREVGSLA